MSLFDERKDSKVNWKVNLVVLWIGVFFACASYTGCVPFLPIFVLKEMQVAPEDVNYWTGIVYSVTFLGSAVMAPYWGHWQIRLVSAKWLFAQALVWPSPIF